MLLNLLPEHVIPRLESGQFFAEQEEGVSVIFTDIKGFTAYSSKISPHELVDFLNGMYSAFDEVITSWELYKVEIIGDAYFISAGCPNVRSILPGEYAMRATEVALALLRTLPRVCDDPTVNMRVGIHSGRVVAGIVGVKGPRYHLFGQTVAYAEKMESHGVPGRV